MGEASGGAPQVPDLPATALPYAQPATQLGVFVHRDAEMLRVVVPPLRGWRVFAPWQWAVLIIGGLRIGIGLSENHVFLIDLIAIVAVLAFVGFTFWRRRVFQITSEAVGVGFVRGVGVMWQHEWPTKSVGEIKMNPSNGRLLIRITGADMKEFRISGSRVVTQFVADELAKGLDAFRQRALTSA